MKELEEAKMISNDMATVAAALAGSQNAQHMMEYEEEIPYIGPPRVLVVEDEPSICRALNIALARAGFDCTTAQTGEVAAALLQHRKFDLLVLDFRMPDMKGDVICHLALSYQPHLRYRTLFITGDITERASKMIEACNCPVLHKPFELSELISHLREMHPQMMVTASRAR